jgi:hypothetical protein
MMAQWQKIIALFGADKKKLGIMFGLIALGMLLWGRLLLMHVPREALAQPAAANAAPDHGQAAEPARKVVNVDLPVELTRDVFALDARDYARVPQPPGAEISSPAPGKSVDESADETARIKAVNDAAATLQLRTTVLGNTPRATIGNLTVREGQTIKGFLIKKILPRQVVVEKDGVEVLLEM